MNTPTGRGLTAFVAGLFLLAVSLASFAQDFPARPLKIVVPLAPGGGTDFFGRLLAGKLSENLGQPVLVENRPGGATMIGAEAVAKAPADGHTLLLSALTTCAVNPHLFRKMPYDPLRDFAPVSLTGRFALLLVVNADMPARTVAEFIALAKSRPGALDFGSPGPGSTHQLAMELFMQGAGIRLTHVPYKGAGPAMQELLAGRIPAMILDVSTGLPHLKSGRLRALAIASADRSPLMPDVPTIAESVLPGYEASAWQGVVAPAGTPPPVVSRLNAEITRAIADAGVRQKLLDAGIEPLRSTPEQFSAYIRSETVKWAEVVRKGNIREQ